LRLNKSKTITTKGFYAMKIRKIHIVQAFALIAVLIFALAICAGAHAQQAGGTSSLSCPSGYALHIDPTPPPTDDTGQPTAPMTAVEKQQAAEQNKAVEMARWHCVPMPGTAPQQ
jgi:hypothetical protein